MPIVLTGKFTCEKCLKEFEWNNFEFNRHNINSPEFAPEPMPSGKTLAHYCYQQDFNVYSIQVNCPNCGFDNHFTYEIKESIKV